MNTKKYREGGNVEVEQVGGVESRSRRLGPFMHGGGAVRQLLDQSPLAVSVVGNGNLDLYTKSRSMHETCEREGMLTNGSERQKGRAKCYSKMNMNSPRLVKGFK